MTNYTWRTGSGALDVASNWTPASVPTSSDATLFNAIGGTLTGSGNFATLTIAGAVWTLSSQLITGALAINNSSFAVSTNTAQLEVGASGFGVGLTAYGALSATNYGVITDTAGPSAAPAQFGSGSFSLSNRAEAIFSGNLSLGVNGLSTTATDDAALLAVGGTLLVGAGGSPAGGYASLTVQDGGEVLMTGAANSGTSSSILQIGSQAGTNGVIQVTGANSLLLSTNNATTVGVAGIGTLIVSGSGAARFGSANNGLAPALTIAALAGATGTVAVSGPSSALTTTGSVVVGLSGTGSLSLGGGATASAAYSLASAFSVAANPGSHGSVSVDGSGSVLSVNGTAAIGGDNRGTGAHAGGVGTVALTNGGSLQVASTLTVYAGSQISVDGSSLLSVSGNIGLSGLITSSGTLSVGGVVYGSGTLQVVAGLASIGAISSANISLSSSSATLYLRGVYGSNTLSGMQYGNTVDLVGITGATISNNTVVLSSGATIALSGAPGDTQYMLSSDGNGGTDIVLDADTDGVYRFFDTDYGTHFFTGNPAEANQVMATRSDLVYEGVGLQAVDPASGDPNASPVYRFFDSNYGTHFFTASSVERDQLESTRPDLVYEGVGFYEHTSQQPGDTPVYRLFDSTHGTHFYTDSSSELAGIEASRPDLIYEGIGFYEPA